MGQRVRERVIGLFLVAAGVALALALGEAALRAVDFSFLGPDMQRYADSTGEFLHGFPNGKPGFGHWNQAGHALGAVLISRHLCGK